MCIAMLKCSPLIIILPLRLGEKSPNGANQDNQLERATDTAPVILPSSPLVMRMALSLPTSRALTSFTG